MIFKTFRKDESVKWKEKQKQQNKKQQNKKIKKQKMPVRHKIYEMKTKITSITN